MPASVGEGIKPAVFTSQSLLLKEATSVTTRRSAQRQLQTDRVPRDSYRQTGCPETVTDRVPSYRQTGCPESDRQGAVTDRRGAFATINQNCPALFYLVLIANKVSLFYHVLKPKSEVLP